MKDKKTNVMQLCLCKAPMEGPPVLAGRGPHPSPPYPLDAPWAAGEQNEEEGAHVENKETSMKKNQT